MQIGRYKITENALWMLPYCQMAADLVPRMKYLREISFHKPRLDRVNHCRAITHKTACGRDYYITIHSHRVYVLRQKPFLEYYPYNTIETLSNLAHELSHLQHWSHTVLRMNLELKIMVRFMEKLKKDGYKTEEKDSMGRFYFSGGR